MSGPRNRKAFTRSQRAREVIRSTWLRLIEQQPFRRWTARHIRRELPAQFASLSERAIQWHMARITLEAELTELGCVQRNSDTDSEAA